MSPHLSLFTIGNVRQAWQTVAARPLAVICLSWALAAFCYPPSPIGPLAFAAIVPLFLATSRLRGKQALSYNFVGGLGFNLIVNGWMLRVLTVHPTFLLWVGVCLFFLFLSCFNALLGWMFNVLAKKHWLLIFFPLCWAGLEVLQTKGPLTFPWNSLGYALGPWNTMIQAASFLGVFGLSAVVVACNCLWYCAWRAKGIGRIVLTTAGAAIPLFLIGYGNHSLGLPDLVGIGSMDISLVQPSIPLERKWAKNHYEEVMAKTFSTLRGDEKQPPPALGSELIIFPETAVPDFLENHPDLPSSFQRLATEYRADFLVGAMSIEFERVRHPRSAPRFFNAVFLFPKDAFRGPRRYSKLRLVPFAERLPMKGIFPLVSLANLGDGDFFPGEDYSVWGDRVRYSPSICYEVTYPDFARAARRKGGGLLVNVNNDGWFGFSNEPYQHVNITRFRAIETGAPVARCSNAGISVFYDYKGREIGKTRLFEQTVLRRRLSMTSRVTWYLRHGDAVESALAWLFGIGLTLCLWFAWRGRSRAKVLHYPA